MKILPASLKHLHKSVPNSLHALRFTLLLFVYPLVGASYSNAQTWTPLTNGTPFQASQPLLLTDGSVLCQSYLTPDWYRLVPDKFGSYKNGKWIRTASMQGDYAPLYFASAVLADGKVVVTGGEYNFGFFAFTNKGSVYDPVTNRWTALAPPPGWSNIGDAQCSVLPTGEFVLANPLDKRMAKLDPITLTWTPLIGAGKSDPFDEEGWTLLPNGSILTVDAVTRPNSELYLPSLDKWISAGGTVVDLVDPGGSEEIGPAVLRPDGTVFHFGGSIHNAIYNVLTGTWSAAPDFPFNLANQQVDMADAPACLLPNGNILCMTSPGVFETPVSFFEVTFGTNLFVPTPSTPNAPFLTSFQGRMLMLPTGQVLLTDGSNDVEIYTPTGTYNPAWKPTISNSPAVVNAGLSYPIQGTQFNGLSECSVYGDDAGQATNYPLVRITNISTGHVYYCRTFNHSRMGVATGAAPVSTNFTVPKAAEGGDSTLEVVTNGIPSTSVPVFVIEAPPVDSVEFFNGFGWSSTHFEVGGGVVNARVNLTLPAAEPDGVVVHLTSLIPSVSSVTPSVTVQPGQTTAYFPVFTTPVASDTGVLILASALGGTQFGVDTVLAPTPSSVFISPNVVPGGTGSTGTLYLNGVAPAQGLPVQLTSNQAPFVTVNPVLFIQPGKSYGSFPITTTQVPNDIIATLTASYNGVSASGALKVTAAGLSSFVISPSSVSGGTPSMGFLTLLKPAPAAGSDVDLTYNPPGQAYPATFPASVHINGGQTQAAFAITTTPTGLTMQVPIKATLRGTASNKTATLTVMASGVSSITITPTVMHAGTTTLSGYVFLSGPASAVGANVTLAVFGGGSTNPVIVKIPAGQSRGQFSFTAPTPVSAAGITVTVSATYPAGVTKFCQVKVIP